MNETYPCNVCSGVGEALGQLGSRIHCRCRQCGWEWSFSERDEPSIYNEIHELADEND